MYFKTVWQYYHKHWNHMITWHCLYKLQQYLQIILLQCFPIYNNQTFHDIISKILHEHHITLLNCSCQIAYQDSVFTMFPNFTVQNIWWQYAAKHQENVISWRCLQHCTNIPISCFCLSYFRQRPTTSWLLMTTHSITVELTSFSIFLAVVTWFLNFSQIDVIGINRIQEDAFVPNFVRIGRATAEKSWREKFFFEKLHL